MVGELEPDQGTIERHPNLRVAYVAQHAFAHIEDHLDMTPCEYVMWRYRGGTDKEMAKKDANTMTEEELKELRKKAKEEKSGVVEVSVSGILSSLLSVMLSVTGAVVSPHRQARARVRGEVGGAAEGEQLAHPH
jgi:ATPase subunit of ABC transporter with duplicated ATPase domains